MVDDDDSAVGSWSPDADPAPAPEAALLERLAKAWQQQGEGLLEALCAGEVRERSPSAEPGENLTRAARAAMRQPRGALDAPLLELEPSAIEALIRLFTLIEARPGWEAGSASPVVPMFRALRNGMQRGPAAGDAAAAAGVDGGDSAVDVDALAAWVKRNSDNRFLPWGSLQDRLRG